jgi:hypothetical protein
MFTLAFTSNKGRIGRIFKMANKKMPRIVFSARCKKEAGDAWRRFLDTLPGDDCEHLEAAMRLYRSVPEAIRIMALRNASELKTVLDGYANRQAACDFIKARILDAESEAAKQPWREMLRLLGEIWPER